MGRKTLHLVYSRGLIQKWYVKRMRGVANNKTYEIMLMCWKGRFPAGTPKERQFVDAGSHTYEDTMLKVPVLHPKDLTYVEKAVLEQSLKSMIGLSEDANESQVADSAADPQGGPGADVPQACDSVEQERSLQENVKKRRLYRRTTEESVVWFPYDNTPTCLRSLFGNLATPAGSCMARLPQAQASWAA